MDEQAIAAERRALLAIDPMPAATVVAPASTSPGAATGPEMAPTPTPTPTPTSTPTPSEAALTPLERVLFVGDSTSWTLSLGVTDSMRDQGVEVRAFPAVGCGIGGATPIRYLNLPERVDATCQTWFEELPLVIERFRPDVVLVVGGVADLSDRRLPDGTWSHVGQPAFDDWLRDRMDRTVDVLTTTGAVVGWTTLPHLFVLPNPGFTGPPPFAENDPVRSERYDELIVDLADGHDRVGLVDLAAYLRARPGGEFAPGLRPDGVHIDSREFPDISAFLADSARALFEDRSGA